MKHSLQICLFLIFGLACQLTDAQTSTGTLVNPNIPAPSLAGNLLGTLTTQAIAVYLPPSYNTSSKKYPVIYFLGGFGDRVSDWTNGTYQGFKIHTSMDRLIDLKSVNEMIVVIVSGYNFLGGSFYVNSPVSGNWEDFVINDVVGYIDTNYRTLQDKKFRAISGHSMGGFGALNLAMRHPDLFGAVYALSPGLFAEDGLRTCQIFKTESFIRQFIAKETELNTLSTENAFTSFTSYIQGRYSVNDWDTPFGYAYAAAFSPNEKKKAPFINYPFSLSGTSPIVDSVLLKNFENGFGGLKEKVKKFKAILPALKQITIDVGSYDEYIWIRNGCQYFSQLLTNEVIAHSIVTFNGGHQDKVRERFEQHLLPVLSSVLAYDSLTVDVKSEVMSMPFDFKLHNYPNPFNPTTTIEYNIPDARTQNFVSLRVFDVLGREVAELVQERKPAGTYRIEWNASMVPSGIYFYRLQVGSFAESSKLVVLK